jgi:hypothetical protein
MFKNKKASKSGPGGVWAYSVKTVVFPSPTGYMLGPLHTRAKSRDHDIVRAQKKVSKGRPNTPPKSCSVVTDPQA